jgi:hypothetical protein
MAGLLGQHSVVGIASFVTAYIFLAQADVVAALNTPAGTEEYRACEETDTQCDMAVRSRPPRLSRESASQKSMVGRRRHLQDRCLLAIHVLHVLLRVCSCRLL